MNKIIGTLLIAGGTALLSFQAAAETIYQSVGPAGEVTFSDQKPADAVEVKELRVAPEPAPEATHASRQRTQRMIEEAEKSQQQRDAAKEQKQAELEAARQRVKTAEANLKEAEEVREGDRLGTAGGGSRLTPAYFDRVEAAKAELEAARKALKDARSR